MTRCCIDGCISSTLDNKFHIRFFTIPLKPKKNNVPHLKLAIKRHLLWLMIIGKSQTSSIEALRVCSLHFEKCQPSSLKDCEDVDWIPNRNIPIQVSNIDISDSDINNEIELINLCATNVENLKQNCSVSGCANNIAKNIEMPFYKFPFHKPKLLKKWILFCENSQNWIVDHQSVICAIHFKRSLIPNINAPFRKSDAELTKVTNLDVKGNMESKESLRNKHLDELNTVTYKGTVFRELSNQISKTNLIAWECSINKCPSILYTQDREFVNLSEDHNHLIGKGENSMQKKISLSLSSDYKCSVYNCSSKILDVDMNGCEIRFLEFPPVTHLVRQFWTRFCDNGPDWVPNKKSYICSIHFEEYSMIPTLNKSHDIGNTFKIKKRGQAKIKNFNEAIYNLKKIEGFLRIKNKYEEIGIVSNLTAMFKNNVN